MNWELFSPIGYASVVLWLCMPLLWLLHWLRGRRGWLVHIALLLGVMAFILAKANSELYVNRIQVDRTEQIQEQLTRQELAQQAATEAREGEVAPIRFAEDDQGEFLDLAGMDEADRKYLQSLTEDTTPDWKKEKQQRSADLSDDSLESQIGQDNQQEGIASTAEFEDEAPKAISMSDRDKLAADRLDLANLRIIPILLLIGLVILVYDYLRRANMYDRAYFPLPLPSRWLDSVTPPQPVAFKPQSPRRTLLEELRVIGRRGESFVLVTDDERTAAQATTNVCRLPLDLWPVEVLDVAEFNGKMDDDFVFETLWYGRNCFVVNSAERGEQMLKRFLELLVDRRNTRAHVRRRVRIVWDVANPLSEETLRYFAILGRATGFSLMINRKKTLQEA